MNSSSVSSVDNQVTKIDTCLLALQSFVDAKRSLRTLEIVRSERIIGEIGEWYFVNLFGGERASRTSQKGWDVSLGGKKIQVKTHAKSTENTARWTEVSEKTRDNFDDLYVIVFTQDLVLSEIRRCDRRVIMKKIVKWDDLELVRWNEVPNQDFLEYLRRFNLLTASLTTM